MKQWLRFSLSSLLVTVAIVSGGLAWYAQHRGWQVTARLQVISRPQTQDVLGQRFYQPRLYQPPQTIMISRTTFEQSFLELANSNEVIAIVLQNLSKTGNALLEECDDPSGWLRDHLDFAYDARSQVLSITLRCRNDWEGDVVKIVEVVADSIMELALLKDQTSRETVRTDFRHRLAYLTGRLDRARQSPAGPERALRGGLIEAVIGDSETRPNAYGASSAVEYVEKLMEDYRQRIEKLENDKSNWLQIEAVGPVEVERFW